MFRPAQQQLSARQSLPLPAKRRKAQRARSLGQVVRVLVKNTDRFGDLLLPGLRNPGRPCRISARARSSGARTAAPSAKVLDDVPLADAVDGTPSPDPTSSRVSSRSISRAERRWETCWRM